MLTQFLVTLIAVLIAYATGLVDDGLLRPVDRLVLRVPSRAEKHLHIHLALRKVILALSDQQIVTGIAILGAGFQGLRTGEMSVYHFQIVIYLAWMSSSVHLSALTILGPYLLHHRGLLAWRLVGMLVLLVMLIIALVPTVSNLWAVLSPAQDWNNSEKTSFGAPALCFWGTTWGDGVNPDAVVSFLVLIVSYLWKMGSLFSPATSTFYAWIRDPLDRFMEKILVALALKIERKARRRDLWLFRACLAVYLSVTATLEVMGSFCAALWLSLLGLIYGMLQILIPRNLVQSFDQGLAERESTLTFGQLVPIILLIQPIGALTEHLWLVEEAEERIYKSEGETKHSFPRSKNGQPLLQFMTTYVVPRSGEAEQRRQLKALLYGSKLFHSLIWLIQAATAATAVVVFLEDYDTIGYTTAGSWQFISYAIAGYMGASPLLVIILAPFSSLGRSNKHRRGIELLEREQTFEPLTEQDDESK